MPTTLEYSGTTITLDDDLYWVDEHSWQPVEQTMQRTVTGAVVVQIGTREAGRPITLQPDENCAWMQKSVLDQLQAWAAVAGRVMTLTLKGVERDVMFRHQDGAIEATPVVDFNEAVSTDWYRVTLRFFEV
jgi:hypothetical protein